MEEKIIIVKDENGKEREGEILFTFDANGDNFILYVIDETVYASKIDEENNLFAIDEDEWDIVEQIYNDWLEEKEEKDVIN